jgi:hypothetical protein
MMLRKNNLNPEIFGEIIGFGMAMIIFTSIWYYILSRFNIIQDYLSYEFYISIFITVYLIYLGVFKKWEK